ncbi:MAG: DNA alkylation repair protein [Candidatus Aenigmarchaeota archaeon]|nr:DNA alkylation repair protein [Candidatus Aenigmarchaeota archaeon]
MPGKIEKDLQSLSNPQKAKILSRFFKTGKGQYGEGDIFLGLQVPQSREIANKYITANFTTIKKLLQSKIHEHRLVALLILVEKFRKADEKNRKLIVDFYLKNTNFINNWDLVDLSADKIPGEYLFDKEKSLLYKLAKSKNLWEKRIAIVSTFAFIKKNRFKETFKITRLLLEDKHDLIHKACGWMLREVGKRNQKEEEKFLRQHYKKMPRTMLRYAIERFDEKKKEFYMRR